jgi:hypothetical protein
MCRQWIILSCFFHFLGLDAQMNFRDSTVQAICYWELGDTMEYQISFQKLQYNETDTLTNEILYYDVVISVIESYETAYTIRWKYKNVSSSNNESLIQKLSGLIENLTIDFRIDEMGVFEEVVNWEEIRSYVENYIEIYGSQPIVDKFFEDFINMYLETYASKESFESGAILDIIQFHYFYGVMYEMNEVYEYQTESANLYEPEKPFTTEVAIVLQEMDSEFDYYVLRSFETMDSDQITDASYLQIKEIVESSGQEMVSREQFQSVSYNAETVSIIHDSGWLLESVHWRYSISEETTHEETRNIVLK